MQIIRYLVSTRRELYTNNSAHVTEYSLVYQEPIRVYKGIDNRIEFILKNGDQKPIDLSGYKIVFKLFDKRQELIAEYSSDQQYIIKHPHTGLFTVHINKKDLTKVDIQYLYYNVILEDSSNNQLITYANTGSQVRGEVLLDDTAFPLPRPSIIITRFENTADTWYSETINAEPEANGNEALHTAVIYANSDFKSTVYLEATLDSSLDNTFSTDWSTIFQLEIEYPEKPISFNFNGVYNYLRFRFDADPNLYIEKIAVRN